MRVDWRQHRPWHHISVLHFIVFKMLWPLLLWIQGHALWPCPFSLVISRMTHGWKHLPAAHPASHHPCLSSPRTQSASADHYMSNTVCTQRHTKAGSSPGPVAGIKGKLATDTFICPSICLSTKASNVTFSPYAQPLAAPDMWSALQSVNDCGPTQRWLELTVDVSQRDIFPFEK